MPSSMLGSVKRVCNVIEYCGHCVPHIRPHSGPDHPGVCCLTSRSPVERLVGLLLPTGRLLGAVSMNSEKREPVNIVCPFVESLAIRQDVLANGRSADRLSAVGARSTSGFSALKSWSASPYKALLRTWVTDVQKGVSTLEAVGRPILGMFKRTSF